MFLLQSAQVGLSGCCSVAWAIGLLVEMASRGVSGGSGGVLAVFSGLFGGSDGVFLVVWLCVCLVGRGLSGLRCFR